jgi:hypothetical protein
MIFVATKNGSTHKKIFPPPLLVLLFDPGPGWIKIWIRDKHPGSATLTDVMKYFKIPETCFPRRRGRSRLCSAGG